MLYSKLNGILIESRDNDSNLEQFKTDLYSSHSPEDLEVGVESKETVNNWWNEKAELLKTYADFRKQEYDKLNQWEMQFDDNRDGTTTWVDSINEIKVRFPK